MPLTTAAETAEIAEPVPQSRIRHSSYPRLSSCTYSTRRRCSSRIRRKSRRRTAKPLFDNESTNTRADINSVNLNQATLVGLLLLTLLSTATVATDAPATLRESDLLRNLQTDPFAQQPHPAGFEEDDEEDGEREIFHAIHCSQPGAKRYAIDTEEDDSLVGGDVGVGPVLQECHPVVAGSDSTKTLGNVCVDIVPAEDTSIVSVGAANATQAPSIALRFSFVGLQTTDEDGTSSSTTFLDHSVWVGDSVHDVPRQETGDIDYDEFPAQWHSTTAGGARQWQSQLPLDCHGKKRQSFYVITGSLASTTTGSSQPEKEFSYAMEFDGQGGNSWYSWMEIQVDCRCSTVAPEEPRLPKDLPVAPQDASSDGSQDFVPYGSESCHGPDLFRLGNDSSKDTSSTSDTFSEDKRVCWDMVDSVLHTPMSRLCIEITNQDTTQTEIAVTFSSLGYSKLIQTSFWAGIHPDQSRIQDIPTHTDKGGQLKLEAWDQFFWDPHGLPDIVFDFHLPTDLCTYATQPSSDTDTSTVALDATSSNFQDDQETFQKRSEYDHMVMTPQGIVAIPMVAFAESKAQTPEGMFLSNSAGYVYEYRQVNDQTEFGWMELQLQCGCSRSHKHEELRRYNGHTKAVGSIQSKPPTIQDKQPKTRACRTAFAYTTSKPEMIHPLSDLGYDAWGYTNGPFSSSYSYITMDLYESIESEDSEDDPQEQKVGLLKVFFDGDEAEVTFTMDETFPLYETQVYVGTDPLPLFNQKASAAGLASAVALFGMPNQHGLKDIDTQYSDSYSVPGFDYGDTIYVMAYAADCAVEEGIEDSQNSTSASTSQIQDTSSTNACLRSDADCYSLTSRAEAGASLPDISVGQVCFALDSTQEYLDVQYSLPNKWSLVEGEVWIGEILKDLPTQSDKSPDLVNFPHQSDHQEVGQSWSTRIPLFRKEQCALSQSGSFDFVAVAHALVGSTCTSTETCDSPIVAGTERHAYAEETLIQKKGKGFFYVDLSIDCHCSDASDKLVLPENPPTIPPTHSQTATPSVSATPTKPPTGMPIPGPPTPASPAYSDIETAAPREIDMANTCIYTDDDAGEYCLSLYAAEAWETSAGSVCLVMVDGQLAIIYDVVNYWSLAEANVWVGSDILDIPISVDGNPDVNAFPYSTSWPQGTDSFTEVVPMDAETQRQCQTKGAFDFFVMAHGLVAEPAISPTKDQPFVPFSEEDAYAKAIDFSGTSSASYIIASVICDCDAFYGHEKRRSLSDISTPHAHSVPILPTSASGFLNTPSASPAQPVDDISPPATIPNKLSASTPDVVVPDCVSAWAIDENLGTICYPAVNETYGWSNGPLRVTEGLVILDMYKATDDCRTMGTHVGAVWVSWNDEKDEIDVDFKLDGDAYYLSDTHVYLGTDQLYRNGSQETDVVVPSLFPLQHNGLSAATTQDTYGIQVNAETLFDDLMYLSAHATVCRPAEGITGSDITNVDSTAGAGKFQIQSS